MGLQSSIHLCVAPNLCSPLARGPWKKTRCVLGARLGNRLAVLLTALRWGWIQGQAMCQAKAGPHGLDWTQLLSSRTPGGMGGQSPLPGVSLTTLIPPPSPACPVGQDSVLWDLGA